MMSRILYSRSRLRQRCASFVVSIPRLDAMLSMNPLGMDVSPEDMVEQASTRRPGSVRRRRKNEG
jgi:hypothetical protein